MQVAFRLTEGLVARLDACAAELTKAQPGMTITRTDVVRILLSRALDADPAAARRKRS